MNNQIHVPREHLIFWYTYNIETIKVEMLYLYNPTSLDLYVTFHLYVNMLWLANKHWFGINYLMLFQNAKVIIN